MKQSSMKLMAMVPLALFLKASLSVAALADEPSYVHTSNYQFDQPSGVWRGEWRSGKNGHHGPMRVVIQPRSDGSYQARFSGRFALIVPFAYRTTLQPGFDSLGNQVLTANKPLPLLGSYQMTAQRVGNELNGSFQAAGDNGSIHMQRVR